MLTMDRTMNKFGSQYFERQLSASADDDQKRVCRATNSLMEVFDYDPDLPGFSTTIRPRSHGVSEKEINKSSTAACAEVEPSDSQDSAIAEIDEKMNNLLFPLPSELGVENHSRQRGGRVRHKAEWGSDSQPLHGETSEDEREAVEGRYDTTETVGRGDKRSNPFENPQNKRAKIFEFSPKRGPTWKKEMDLRILIKRKEKRIHQPSKPCDRVVQDQDERSRHNPFDSDYF